MKCSALEMNDKDGMRRTTAAEGGETVCRPHDSSLLPLTLNFLCVQPNKIKSKRHVSRCLMQL